MRQIAILPEQTARLFADYLSTLEVETQLLPEPTGLGVWVRDEDKVTRRVMPGTDVTQTGARSYAPAADSNAAFSVTLNVRYTLTLGQ